jgi:hypothetical protein
MEEKKIGSIDSTTETEEKETVKIAVDSVELNKRWKEARLGIIVFCVLHLFYEVMFNNPSLTGPMVVVNYFISSAIVNGVINKGKRKNNLFLFGFSISCFVFLIRVIIGLLLLPSLTY